MSNHALGKVRRESRGWEGGGGGMRGKREPSTRSAVPRWSPIQVLSRPNSTQLQEVILIEINLTKKRV